MRLLLLISLVFGLAAGQVTAQAQDETDEGGGFLERLIEDNLSGADRDVRITGFAGALSSQATLDTLTIADADGIWLRLEDVTLDWTRSALLRGELKVNRLDARAITLARLPESERRITPEMAEAQPFELPDLPVSVEIGQIRAGTLTVGAPVLGEEVRLELIGNLFLAGGEGAASIDVTRLDGRGKISLDARFDNADRMLAIDLALDESEGGIAATLLSLPGEPAVNLSIAGEAPLSDYEADLRLATNGTERLTGKFTLTAPEGADTRFGARLSGDITPLLASEYRPFFGKDSRMTLSGTLGAAGTTDIDVFRLTTSQLALEGSLSLDAAGWPDNFQLNGSIGSGATPVRLPVAGSPVTLGNATLEARYNAARGDRWTARLAISEIAQQGLELKSANIDSRGVLRRAPPRGVSALAEIELSGLKFADQALAQAAGDSLSGHLSLDWRQNQPLVLRGLRLVSGAARLSARGEVAALSEGLPLSGRMRVDVPDLARFSAIAGQDLSGTANAALTGSGALLEGSFDVSLHADTDRLALGIPYLDPVIAEPGEISVEARRDTSGTILDRFHLENDHLRATARGKLDSRSGDLTLSAGLDDLGLSHRDLSGPARFRGDVAWQAGGDITLSGVAAQAMGAELGLTGTFSPETDGLPVSGSLSASVSDLSRFNAISGQSMRGSIDLTLDGETSNSAKDFTLATRLEGRELASGIADLDRLIAGRISIRANAGRTPERIELDDLTVETPRLSLVAMGDDAEGSVDITARLSDIGILAPDLSGPLSAEGTAALHGPEARRVTLELDAKGPGGTTASLAGDVIDHGRTLALSGVGRLPLALINGLVRPNALNGTAEYDLAINGAPALSSVSGTVTTSGTRVALPATGLAVEDLSGTATLGNARVQTGFTARMRDGGRLTVSGPVSLKPGYQGDLSAGIEGLVLSDQLLYTTTASGNVSVDGPLAGGALIGGAISLEETNIRIPSGFGAASVSLPGLRHVNEPGPSREMRKRAGLIRPEERTASRPFALDLTIDAPNRIFVRGRGLDAELGGRLRVAGTTEAVAPDGFFELIRGRIDILGKRLDLTEGRVTMQGSLDPYLRFVAQTETEDVTVRIILEGVASEPGLTFTSEPELPQEEIVSRLIFGRGLDNISPLQAAQMASAVATLAGNSNNDVVGKLRGAVGFADLDVTQTAEGDTEVSAGAYLSDDIYTEVTADSAGKQRINLNLDLTNSVTVKGGASNDGDTGIGIFFERDY